MHMDNRKAPMKRLIQKLGLQRVPQRRADGRCEGWRPARVGIRLKQHVGAPCEPAVKVGQKVAAGDVVGRPPMKDGKPALGAPVHASIAGAVTEIRDGAVWIQT